ncbi:MAG: hypothetical protein NTU69_02250 [Proteobacteria bacterium]|jgi:hypothetical protein|nr:hypothetical protein [Pseudomonadota bacterium]
MEKEVVKLIKARGPLTGSELREAIEGDSLILWQACNASKKLLMRTLGTRYLRLDRRVDGYARLSPSILREFLTYSVIGLDYEPDALARRAQEIEHHIEEVSRSKFELAHNIVSDVRRQLEDEWPEDHRVCFIVAGDIVYNMAHDVPRPEKSTGKMVQGSDIDLIVVVDDQLSDDFIKRLDDSIYHEKHRILIAPSLKEEIDYVVKRLKRVRDQVRFDTFKHMVACKILQEGMLLYGSEDLFHTIKDMLYEYGVTEKLNNLEKLAIALRNDVEEYLLGSDLDKIKREDLYLFYSAEESEEFE